MEGKTLLVVGLGRIGSGLARVAILRNQFNVIVWNRSVDKAEKLFSKKEMEEEGIKYTIAKDLEQGINDSDIIAISLNNYESAYKALEQNRENISEVSSKIQALSGKTVLQLRLVIMLNLIALLINDVTALHFQKNL